MKSKRLKTLIFTGFSAFYSFLSVKLGYIILEGVLPIAIGNIVNLYTSIIEDKGLRPQLAFAGRSWQRNTVRQERAVAIPLHFNDWPMTLPFVIIKSIKDVMAMLLTSLYITIALFVFMFFVNIGVQLVKLLFRLIRYLIHRFIYKK
nr:MAG TPA: hypothetical protein [Caudoviricetes sp.]